MVSRLTSDGAEATTEALMEGAFDFVLKPSGDNSTQTREMLKEALAAKIEASRADGEPRNGTEQSQPTQRRQRDSSNSNSIDAVVIGTSTGGPEALRNVIPSLSAQLSVPVIIVQHMPPRYTSSLARRLDSMSPLSVGEVETGDDLKPGTVSIAPGDRQLRLRRDGKVVTAEVTDDPPEHGCHPQPPRRCDQPRSPKSSQLKQNTKRRSESRQDFRPKLLPSSATPDSSTAKAAKS